ncbi:hypothetical protein [Mesorhizobium sp. M0859]|uniref:IS1096 element passenger TnpR family protein n=1 Tax=Mesorhizobium sp. M0859 TaxID=2957014 RepID=UPI0033370951
METSAPDVRCRQEENRGQRTDTKASRKIITFTVTLRGTKPPVWRRLVMRGTMTLGDLHGRSRRRWAGMMATSMPSTSAASSFGDRHSVDDVADENRVTQTAEIDGRPLHLHL